MHVIPATLRPGVSSVRSFSPSAPAVSYMTYERDQIKDKAQISGDPDASTVNRERVKENSSTIS